MASPCRFSTLSCLGVGSLFAGDWPFHRGFPIYRRKAVCRILPKTPPGFAAVPLRLPEVALGPTFRLPPPSPGFDGFWLLLLLLRHCKHLLFALLILFISSLLPYFFFLSALTAFIKGLFTQFCGHLTRPSISSLYPFLAWAFTAVTLLFRTPSPLHPASCTVIAVRLQVPFKAHLEASEYLNV